MNENRDIITLETAILAKEKGFQEEELHYYFNRELLQHPNRLYYNYNQDNPPLEQYSAPYQSFLQKWLREEYKLSLEVFSLSYHNKIQFTFNIKKLNGCEITILSKNNLHYDSHEEALEAGLVESLKLI